MSTLKPDIAIESGDVFSQISNASGTVPYNTFLPAVGSRATTGDGRDYRLVQAGGSALIVGQAHQCAAFSSNLQGVTALTTAVGSTVTLTISTGTAITVGQFSGGFLTTYGTVANGGGQNLQISSNTAVTSSGTSITFTLVDPLVTALTTSATVTIVPPNYVGVIQTPSTSTNKIAGVGVGALPANYYGWLQVKGLANVLITGTPGAITGLYPASAAGAFAVTDATHPSLAQNLMTGVDGRYGPVDLHIS